MMNVKLPSWISIGLMLLAFLSPATIADEVIMANGDRISGNILYVSPRDIQIETEYAGLLCVDFSEVAHLSTETPGKILLGNGESITGVVKSMTQMRMIVSSEDLGEIEVPLDSLLSYQSSSEINPASAETGAAFSPHLDVAAQAKKAGHGGWTGSIALGTQLHEGNTDSDSMRLDFLAVRKIPQQELRLKAYACYGETDGITDQNDVYGEAKIKIFPNTHWYLFGVSTAEYDEIRDIDLRAEVFGGPGYNFIQTEDSHLLGEFGLGLTMEIYDTDGEADSLEPSVWLNAEWRQKLMERVEFFQALTIFPSIDTPGDYRFRSTTALCTPLGDHWALKLSAIDEYDSKPATEDIEKNDLRILSSIEYTF